MIARTRSRLFIALWLAVSCLAWARVDQAFVRALAPASANESLLTPLAKPKTAADLVVLVSIDGLRPDVITEDMRALHQLFLKGASAKVARTINKSATLPSHASMVSGVDASEHGIDFNAYRPERANITRPTMFSVAHAAGLSSYMFVGKAKLKHLLGKPSDAELKVAGVRCSKVVKEATPALQQTKRGVIFLHFADPDGAGHRHGWMTDQYVAAARDADHCLGQVMQTLEATGRMSRTLLLVTSDHGGHARNHGTRMEVDQRIPWYAWGASVRRGRMKRDVHTTDTAATVIAALGLAVPKEMRGQPVSEVLNTALGPVGLPLVGAPVATD